MEEACDLLGAEAFIVHHEQLDRRVQKRAQETPRGILLDGVCLGAKGAKLITQLFQEASTA